MVTTAHPQVQQSHCSFLDLICFLCLIRRTVSSSNVFSSRYSFPIFLLQSNQTGCVQLSYIDVWSTCPDLQTATSPVSREFPTIMRQTCSNHPLVLFPTGHWAWCMAAFVPCSEVRTHLRGSSVVTDRGPSNVQSVEMALDANLRTHLGGNRRDRLFPAQREILIRLFTALCI